MPDMESEEAIEEYDGTAGRDDGRTWSKSNEEPHEETLLIELTGRTLGRGGFSRKYVSRIWSRLVRPLRASAPMCIAAVASSTLATCAKSGALRTSSSTRDGSADGPSIGTCMLDDVPSWESCRVGGCAPCEPPCCTPATRGG